MVRQKVEKISGAPFILEVKGLRFKSSVKYVAATNNPAKDVWKRIYALTAVLLAPAVALMLMFYGTKSK